MNYIRKAGFAMAALAAIGLSAGNDVLFHEDFNVFRGKGAANWETLKTSSNMVEVFVRDGNTFRLLSPSDMFMPIMDPVSDGKVDLVIRAYGFDPKCNYGFNVNFRQDVVRRTAQSIRFFVRGKSGKMIVSYGTYADNFFKTIKSESFDVPADVMKNDCTVSVEFKGDKAIATFNGKSVSFDGVGGTDGQLSINRMNFFDSLVLSKFEVSGKKTEAAKNARKFRVTLPEAPMGLPIYCDVEFSEHGLFYEAVLTLSGGEFLTPPGQGNYHGMRTNRIDHPYFKVITKDKTIEYNLLDGFLHLANKEIAPIHVYTVIYDKPEWPFKRTIRFFKPQGAFDMAVGAKLAAFRPHIDLTMKDWETIFTPEGKTLFAGTSPESNVSVILTSSPDKKIVAKLPRTSTRVEDAINFAKVNHFFYPGEALDFTLTLKGATLPAKSEIALADAFLKPVKKLELSPEKSVEKLGQRDLAVETYRIKLDELPVGVYHITVKSQDATIPFDRFMAFEVMPLDPSQPTAAQASGLPYIYSALTETRGLRTDAFDPFKPCERNFGHYVSGTVFLPWYARETNLYDTVHFYGRKYFAWLGSRCLDKWHLSETEDIWKNADVAHFGVELETGGLIALYRSQRLKEFVEFAKQTKDPFYDIPRLEKLALVDGGNMEAFSGMENRSLDAETYRYTVVNHFPEWLEFANKSTAKRIHDKLVELRKVNPKLMFACYGPAPIYTGTYMGPEFALYLGLAKTSPDDVAYLQYEDYPELCDYPESRGSFFLGTLSMSVPQIRIAPELYGDGFGSGCPDGAAFFAHPPYGIGGNNYFYRTRNRVYEYIYGTAFMGDEKFQYWNRFGIQLGAARYERLENFLKAWGNAMRNLPVKPMRSAAYVFSMDSWNANQGGDAHFAVKGVEGTDVAFVLEAAQVRKTASAMMPFIYENVSNNGLCAGYQLMAKNLKNLKAENCDILVLPPLKGVPADQQNEIRRLYNEGVTIICSEEPGDLADLFKVKDGGKFVKVNMAKGTEKFLPGMVDATTDVCFGGRFLADGAEVLIDGEIPVLYKATNGKANAYFFNVPPTTATSDMLWERHGYGRVVISQLMIKAVQEIFARDNKVEVFADSGRVLAAETAKGFAVVHRNNSDEDKLVELTFRKRDPKEHLISFDREYQILQDDAEVLKVRFNTKFRSAAFMEIGR
ncbi:MAG: hypothetical protein MJ033_00305 [Victivallaceae bacterium]|nr:hypothetical protein [Victivallaceae bacterium]